MGVSAVGLESHAASLASLAVEGAARARALELVVRLLDLAPASPGAATARSVRELCASATRPDWHAPSLAVAAVCVPAPFAAVAREHLAGTRVRVSALGLADAADEVELDLDDLHGAKPSPVVKVPLDAEALGTYDALRHASLLAIAAGADFLSVTGPRAAALCVLEAIRDVRDGMGWNIGFRAAEVGSADEAVHDLVLVHEILGPEWLTPARCRIGGSAVLADALAEIGLEATR